MGVVASMSRAPLVRRLRELAARHPQFAVALAAGAVLRLVAMLGYPGALWFAGDSYVYVGAALRPTPDLSKTTGYSLFLRALLPFHSFTLVTGVQHLMGLGIAVMIYLLARRVGVPKLWATVATLPVLLDGFEIEDEHMVMAEALFTFLVMLAMLLILWRYRTPWPTALVAGLLVGYAVDVRSEGLPLLVLFPAFLAYRAVRQGWKNWRGWLAAAALAVGCAAPVVAYAAWFHHVERHYTLSMVRRVLPVGTGVLVRRVLGHQAARRRAEDLPLGLAVQPHAAGRLHLARAAGARHPGRPGERRQRPAAARLRHPCHRGPAVRLRRVGAEGPGAGRGMAAAEVPGRRHGGLLLLPAADRR